MDSDEVPQPFTQTDWDYIDREIAARSEERRSPERGDEENEPGEELKASLRKRIESARRGEVMSLDELREFLGLDQEDKEEGQEK